MNNVVAFCYDGAMVVDIRHMQLPHQLQSMFSVVHLIFAVFSRSPLLYFYQYEFSY